MRKLGLYIHIPFCVKKCNYCDFLSAPATRQVQKSYMDVLQKEIVKKAIAYKDCIVDTVFIGGGTPTSVPYEALVQVIEAMKKNFSLTKDCEISMECNPGTVTKKSLFAYRAAGVNRLSIGLQSTDNELLAYLGRIHTYEQFLETYQMAREAGFDNINVDIMSALPNQTLTQYEDTLLKIVKLGVEHISAYSLIVEEGTPFYDLYEKDNLSLPDEDVERQMYYRTKEILEAEGYFRYEISNYAKKGYECKHNLRYWERKDYIGFGLGAASLYQNTRYKNIDNLNNYLKEDTYMQKTEVENLSAEDCMEEFMFLGLRKIDGVSKDDFFSCFGVSMEDKYGQILLKLSQNGLIEDTRGKVKLTEYGLDVSNVVLAEFLF